MDYGRVKRIEAFSAHDSYSSFLAKHAHPQKMKALPRKPIANGKDRASPKGLSITTAIPTPPTKAAAITSNIPINMLRVIGFIFASLYLSIYNSISECFLAFKNKYVTVYCSTSQLPIS